MSFIAARQECSFIVHLLFQDVVELILERYSIICFAELVENSPYFILRRHQVTPFLQLLDQFIPLGGLLWVQVSETAAGLFHLLLLLEELLIVVVCLLVGVSFHVVMKSFSFELLNVFFLSFTLVIGGLIPPSVHIILLFDEFGHVSVELILLQHLQLLLSLQLPVLGADLVHLPCLILHLATADDALLTVQVLRSAALLLLLRLGSTLVREDGIAMSFTLLRLVCFGWLDLTFSIDVVVLSEYLLQASLGLPDHDFAHEHLRGQPLIWVNLLGLAAAAEARRLRLDRVRLLVDARLGRGKGLELGGERGRVVDVLINRCLVHRALVDVVLLCALQRDGAELGVACHPRAHIIHFHVFEVRQ